MSIEAKDLRIGNYILDQNGNVTQVEAYGLYLFSIENKHGGATAPNVERMGWMPISLTEKWYKKLGLDHNGCIYLGIDVSCHTLQITKNGDAVIYNQDGEITCNLREIKFVHEAQNLYFALKSEELKELQSSSQTI